MLSWWSPISSARAAPSAVTAAALSPALGTCGDSGDEGQHEGEDLLRGLGVRIVAGALDEGEFAESVRQVGEDAFALGAGIGPVGVGAALDDQDRAADVGK